MLDAADRERQHPANDDGRTDLGETNEAAIGRLVGRPVHVRAVAPVRRVFGVGHGHVLVPLVLGCCAAFSACGRAPQSSRCPAAAADFYSVRAALRRGVGHPQEAPPLRQADGPEIVFAPPPSARGLGKASGAPRPAPSSVSPDPLDERRLVEEGEQAAVLAVLRRPRAQAPCPRRRSGTRAPSTRSATRTGRTDRSGRGGPRRPAARARTAGRAPARRNGRATSRPVPRRWPENLEPRASLRGRSRRIAGIGAADDDDLEASDRARGDRAGCACTMWQPRIGSMLRVT